MPKLRYPTIVAALAAQIRAGHFKVGAQLPTLRALMRQHGIALATATRVYQELSEQGLVTKEVGRGTFVRALSLPEGQGLQQSELAAHWVDLAFNYPVLPQQLGQLREGLRQLAQRNDLMMLLVSAPQGGHLHERHTIAKHLRNRGLRVPAEQVLLVNGAQQGLAVTLSALLKPEDVLVTDALTYPGLKALAQQQRLRLQTIPSQGTGMDLTALDALCQKQRIKAVYCMPTVHNPLGWVLSAADRQTLVRLARRHDFILIEDAAYAFLAEPAPRPLYTYAPERTVYVSGLSKSVAPGLRVGWVVAPEPWVAALALAIRLQGWHTPTVMVALACQWIESGLIDTLEVDKRADAAQRQQLMRQVFEGLPWQAHRQGYFVWLPLSDTVRAEEIAALLYAQGIVVTTAEPFSASGAAPQALRLALGSVPLPRLRQALLAVRALVAD